MESWIPRSNVVFESNQGRQEGGGGQIAPGSGGPQNFFVGPQSFFGVKYFRAKGKIFVFFGQSTEIWYEKLR
jgi:hypothetical protein